MKKKPVHSFDTNEPHSCPYKADEAAHLGSWANVTGWGRSDEPTYTGQLQSTAVPLMRKKDCNVALGVRELEGQVCAAFYGEGGRATYQSDFGGPMAINGRLAGIASWGNDCVHPYWPGVYTEVAKYRDWIKEHAGV